MEKSTITIYRVEHREYGHGPYLDENAEPFYGVSGLHRAHDSSRAHPGPYKDRAVGRYHTVEHSFGFGSRDQLDRWFKGFKRKLHAADFVIRVYEARPHSTYISDRQAIFVRDRAKLVDTIPVVRYAR